MENIKYIITRPKGLLDLKVKDEMLTYFYRVSQKKIVFRNVVLF